MHQLSEDIALYLLDPENYSAMNMKIHILANSNDTSRSLVVTCMWLWSFHVRHLQWCTVGCWLCFGMMTYRSLGCFYQQLWNCTKLSLLESKAQKFQCRWCVHVELVHVRFCASLCSAHNRAAFAFQLEKWNVSKCGACEHGPWHEEELASEVLLFTDSCGSCQARNRL